ncbi:NRAMP family, partial [Syncephalis pseudoplumigaleata]
DLGNLESDLQAGALTGYRLLWLLLWSHLVGLTYQILAARLGVATGRSLAEHLRASYPKRSLGILWGFIELALMGADAQLVIGNAIAIQVLFGAPLWLGVAVTALNVPLLSLMSQLGRAGNGQRGKRMEWCFAGAIGVMAGCFFWVMLLSKPDLKALLAGLFVPDVPKKARMQAVGLFGATVMPHNIILHSALVNSGGVAACRQAIVREVAFYLSLESCVTLFISFLINCAILISFACNFSSSKKHGADAKSLPGLYEGAGVLEAAIGPLGPLLWGCGLLAAGQSATITVTMAGQHVLEGFWRRSVSAGRRIAATRAVSFLPALLVACLWPKHMDMLGEWFNVLQSICLPVALVPLLRFTNARSVM